MAYINTYEISCVYAGPEEGGRYFTNREVTGCVRIRGGVNSNKARQAFNRHAKAQGMNKTGYYGRRSPGYWRSNEQIDYALCLLESRPAAASNDWRPYE